MKPIRVLIADDEVYARRGLRMLLDGEQGVEIVGEATDGDQAVEMIRSLAPDVVLLDVAMPGRNGLEVVAEVGPQKMPEVIFVTAYDQYAVAAFEAHAVDYLLKPFTDVRFRETMERMRARIDAAREGDLQGRLAALLDAQPRQRLERFTVRVGETLRVLRTADIDWIEADEYYVKLHVAGETHMVKETMSALEAQLPPDRFVRIHRSTIVNLDRVVELEPLFQGDCVVVLADGTRLRMSRRRRDALGDRLQSFS